MNLNSQAKEAAVVGLLSLNSLVVLTKHLMFGRISTIRKMVKMMITIVFFIELMTDSETTIINISSE